MLAWSRHLGAGLLLATGVLGPMAAVAQPACTPTRADMEGPMYVPGAPMRAETGRGLVIGGTVRSVQGCAPLGGATLEWWSADGQGRYDDAHRATQRADGTGRYRYETDLPGRYPGRPPHVHVRVSAPGHRTLVTQLYPKPGQASLDQDFVLARD